ncbi:cytochrome P450 [Streptomyces sp. STR69]|uniref:cytochrome P450 n=1 Tax=Streptomyces sp. STR69 TaxID=1796942 RepID=UPI0021C6D600|nr:cytochrome P450 [Streptomyces sp. STR69]
MASGHGSGRGAADRGDLTPAQAPLVLRSLLTAYIDTTVHGPAACLYAFARHPEQWQRLRERPELARVAFGGAVRRQSPVQAFFRTATAIAGVVVIPEGTKILMFLGAATRDPAHWTDPDRFNLTRTPPGRRTRSSRSGLPTRCPVPCSADGSWRSIGSTGS